MTTRQKIIDTIEKALNTMGVPKDMVDVALDAPGDHKFGDYSTNVAMLLARKLGTAAKNPFDLAEKIALGINNEIASKKTSDIEKAVAAKPGFVNFFLTKKFFQDGTKEVLDQGVWYGKNHSLWNKKIIIEHTNLNPFKPFHIGHLVNNAVGESLSRILAFQDAKLTVASYGGDVGLHVAKAIWGVEKTKGDISEKASPREIVEFLGKAYVIGSTAYEDDPKAQEEIKIINKKIFDKSDEKLNVVYEWGREASLAYFKELYKRLDTKVDYHFFESEVVNDGLAIVQTGLDKGIFEQSDGAIIYPGEKFGLHNRVFITSQGLPTYEAKDMGLIKKKFGIDNFDQSLTITGNEQNDYFKVVTKAISDIYPEIAKRMRHISHGLLRPISGKMSSRKGNVIKGESFIAEIEGMVAEKMGDREMSESEKKKTIEEVAIGAIKYSILKQTVGRDIIFDPNKSLSFEGDSGPYLQYAYVRTESILRKAKEEGIKADPAARSTDNETELERIVSRFPEVVERAAREMAPSFIATYLIELAGEFNSYYAKNVIVDNNDTSPYRVALAKAVGTVLKNGLNLLGIKAPEKM